MSEHTLGSALLASSICLRIHSGPDLPDRQPGAGAGRHTGIALALSHAETAAIMLRILSAATAFSVFVRTTKQSVSASY